MKRISILSILLLAIAVFSVDSVSAQTRSNRISRPCSGSTTPAVVDVESDGDIFMRPCSGRSVVTGSTDTGTRRFAAGVLAVTDGSTGVRALIGGGAAVASATALPLPTGRVFHVTGTTSITSIVSTNLQSGVCVTLIFDGVLTFTDGGNLVLAGNLVTTADDTISLCFDGTNFYETGRSVN